ncbi:homeobox protein CDX-1-like [Asterias rubens]|uniref:homeobox protein CDX-1-like n=1 Tax=Asterias rubens TaxID=7604 RepID=UPI001455ABCF|nr:homeobox protein CDX-1-like [Asterias rubens]
MDEDEYIRKEKRREQKAKWAKKKRDALRIVSVLEEVRRRPICADAPGTSAPGPSNPVNGVSSPVNLDSSDGTSDEEGSTDHAVHVVVDEDTPGPVSPGYDTPGPASPGYDNLGPASPGYDTPGPASPGYDTPDPLSPGYDDPSPASPGYDNLGPASPGYDDPGPASPGHDDPGSASPGYDDPGPASPGYDDPGSASPDYDDLGRASPGSDPSGPASPGYDNPGPASPGSASPGYNTHDGSSDEEADDNRVVYVKEVDVEEAATEAEFFKRSLRELFGRTSLSRTEQQYLLGLFNRAGVQGLPKDPRTLLCTPGSVNINPSYFGVEYHWFGIDDQLTRALDYLVRPLRLDEEIKLMIGVDGVLIFDSSNVNVTAAA